MLTIHNSRVDIQFLCNTTIAIWCKPTHILACKFICVNLKCRISKFLKFKIFNELDRFFSSFQVPVNESARQVCRSLTCTARSVSFGRVRLRSETFERARPLAGCSQAKGVAWKTTRNTRNAGLLQTVLSFQQNCLLVCYFLFIYLIWLCLRNFHLLPGRSHFISLEFWS